MARHRGVSYCKYCTLSRTDEIVEIGRYSLPGPVRHVKVYVKLGPRDMDPASIPGFRHHFF